MNRTNKLSIHIPVYNSEDTIERCIDSIFAQSYQKFDLYVYEDCSTDKTFEILTSLKKKYKFNIIKNAKNLGLIGNFNKILNCINTEYFAIYHADEIYHKEIVLNELNFLEKYRKEASAVFTNGIFDIGTNKKLIIDKKILFKKNNIYNFDEIFNLILKNYNILICSSAMFVAEDIKKIGFFESRYGMSIDLHFWFKILKSKNVGIINKVLITTHLENSASFNEFNKIQRSDFFDVMDDVIINYYKYNLTKKQKDLYDILKYRDNCRIIKNLLMLGNYDEIKNIFETFSFKFILANLFKSKKCLVVLYVYFFIFFYINLNIIKIPKFFIYQLFKRIS